jgi:hypothetical protein
MPILNLRWVFQLFGRFKPRNFLTVMIRPIYFYSVGVSKSSEFEAEFNSIDEVAKKAFFGILSHFRRKWFFVSHKCTKAPFREVKIFCFERGQAMGLKKFIILC